MVIAYFLVMAVSPADAQSPGAEAEVLYSNGRGLMAVGKTAEACDSFEKSYRLDPVVTTIIALATCREKLGKLINARDLFLMAERQTRSASDSVTRQLHTIARDRAAKLEPRVPKLTVKVPYQSKIDELEILRDSVSIPVTMWNRALPVDGGTYTITARIPGAKEWSTTVTLAPEADSKTVDIPDLRNVTSSLDVSVKEPAVKLPETPDVVHTRRRRAPIVVGSSAVFLLGGAIGFFVWGDSTYDDAKAEMADQARRNSLYDSANRKRYAAVALAVASVGCLGAAVWLYPRQHSTRGEPASRAARLILTPDLLGIGVAGQF